MSADDLFSHGPSPAASVLDPPAPVRSRPPPLAARMRPRSLDDFVGQTHILAPGQLLRRAIEADRIQSLIFYGCLLYTSDAADERSSVDLGGRRIIKKK